MVFVYLVIILFIIAIKTTTLRNANQCMDQIINNSIRLKTFVSNESRLPTEPDWSPLLDNRITTYSAFLTEESVVRITSAVNQDLWAESHFRIECHFRRFQSTSVKYKSVATLKILPENKSKFKRYAVSEIKCFLPLKYHSVLNYVGISAEGFPPIGPLLRLHKTATYYTNDSSLETIVCIRPMFNSENLLSSIVEFLAYYRANGVNKFVFYDLYIDLY